MLSKFDCGYAVHSLATSWVCLGYVGSDCNMCRRRSNHHTAGRMCAIGQLISYVIGSIDTVSIFGSLLGDTQFKQMTVIAAMSLIIAVAVTSYSVKERVLISAR